MKRNSKKADTNPTKFSTAIKDELSRKAFSRIESMKHDIAKTFVTTDEGKNESH